MIINHRTPSGGLIVIFTNTPVIGPCGLIFYYINETPKAELTPYSRYTILQWILMYTRFRHVLYDPIEKLRKSNIIHPLFAFLVPTPHTQPIVRCLFWLIFSIETIEILQLFKYYLKTIVRSVETIKTT